MSMPFALNIARSRIWTPSKTWSLGLTRLSIPNSISVQPAQLMVHVPILYNGCPFSPKVAPSHGGDLDHTNPQPKQHLHQFSRFCTAHRRGSL